MWDSTPRNQAESRELVLKDDFWKSLVDSGASIARHDDTSTSAKGILRRFLNIKKINIDLQMELSEGAQIKDTAAGRELNKEFAEEIESVKAGLQASSQKREEAILDRDFRMRKLIEVQEKKLDEQVQRSKWDIDRMEQDRAMKVKRLEEMIEYRAALKEMSDTIPNVNGCVVM